MGWWNSLQATPIIRNLHHHFESVRLEELGKVLSKLPHLGEDARDKVDVMTRRIIKRLLHVPTTEIKKAAGRKNGALGLAFVSELFGLNLDKKEEK